MLLIRFGTGLGFTTINIAALTGRGERVRTPSFGIDQYFSSNRRPVLLTGIGIIFADLVKQERIVKLD
ncbi:MAG: hypothetical protein WBZ36_26935 [Candidatus Nitrosopolaris sp.]